MGKPFERSPSVNIIPPVQADWTEEYPHALSYIRNKPSTLVTGVKDTSTIVLTLDSDGTLSADTTGPGAPIYTVNQIPYGDGVTPGGITSTKLTFDGLVFHISTLGSSSGWGQVQSAIESLSSEAGLSLANNDTGGRVYNIISTSNASGIGGGIFSIGDATSSQNIFMYNANTNIYTLPLLSSGSTQFVTADTSGNLGLSAAPSPSLTSTYVGYGSGSNVLTGSSKFIYDGATLSIKANSADYFRIVDGSNVKQLYIDSTNQFAFNATGGPFYFGAFANPSGGLAGFSVPGNVVMALAAASLRMGVGGSGAYFAANAPAALLEVRGKADEIQCIIKGNGTQTGSVFTINNSGGTPKIFVDGSYNLNFSAVNIITDTTTGTKIGTGTSQKLSFWNATPGVQPTTGIGASTFVANTSLIFDDSATWDGYTIGQVVKALRTVGILA